MASVRRARTYLMAKKVWLICYNVHTGRYVDSYRQWHSQSKGDARAQHNSVHTFLTLSRAWFNIIIHIILIQTKSAL